MFTFFNRNVYLYTILFTRQCVVHSFVPSYKIQCKKKYKTRHEPVSKMSYTCHKSGSQMSYTCHKPVSQVWLGLVLRGGRGGGARGGRSPHCGAPTAPHPPSQVFI